MGTIQVILAPEQGSVFIQQHGLDRPQVPGHSINSLVHIVVFNMHHFTQPELDQLASAIQHSIAPWLFQLPHIYGWQVSHIHRLTKAIADPLEIAV
ncbi:hypothetical protein GZ77_07265 [Endozoicomonas montiporae]|uniref:Uncharacterized protein n=1 Tax=Endozoicomonas montiporae TaxID=1027273 RepID=A0A081N6Z3_9GAMM|nr:hypothetical protein GZ77_07265 [Endozoicomonas montiporae]